MKIGVISDIHDNIANLEKAIEVLNKEQVDLIFFCGDLCSSNTLEPFQNLNAPVKAVFGNMDKDRASILEKLKQSGLNFEYSPEGGLKWDLELNSKRVAVVHGDNEYFTNNLVNSRELDFVFSGHTHSPHIKKIGETLWINPGPICGRTGLDKKPINPSLTIVDLQTKKAEIVYL